MMEVFKTPDGKFGRVEQWEICPSGHRFIRAYRIWTDTNEFSSLFFAPCRTCEKEKKRADFFDKGHIPKRFRSVSVESFNPFIVEVASSKDKLKEAQARALSVKAACLDYIQDLKLSLRVGKSLIFAGGTGTGKTHLACSIAAETLRQGFTAWYCFASDYCRDIETCRMRKSQVDFNEAKMLNRYATFDLLVLDKLGDRGLTAYERKIVQALLDDRYNLNKATIVVTSLNAPQLEVVIGRDCFDGFRENGGRAYPFGWKSVRSVVQPPEPIQEEQQEVWMLPEDTVHPRYADKEAFVFGKNATKAGCI